MSGSSQPTMNSGNSDATSPTDNPICRCNLPALKLTSKTKENPHRRFWTCNNYRNPRHCGFFLWDDHELNLWYKQKIKEFERTECLLTRERAELSDKLEVAENELVKARRHVAKLEELEEEKFGVIARTERWLWEEKQKVAKLEKSVNEKTELMVFADNEISELKKKVAIKKYKIQKLKKDKKKKKINEWAVRGFIAVLALGCGIALGN